MNLPEHTFRSWNLFNTYEDFAAWLEGKGLFHMDLSLGRMQEAMRKIGQLPCPAVQVLGTNGKGSTCAYISALGSAYGLTSGAYLSPHFVSIRERILVNGQMLPRERWLMAANTLASIISLAELTYFEVLTLLAVEIFREEGVALAVMEAGLGGAHDATTALDYICQCFTPIALDHAHILGPTLTAIAEDKAQAIKENGVIFSAPQYPAAAEVIERVAALRHCRLVFAQPLPFTLHNGLASRNAALAAACWDFLAKQFNVRRDPEKEERALKKSFIAGRMQFVEKTASHPPLILDGGHNPHAIQNLLRQLPDTPETIIYSALADKDWRTCLAMLLRTGARVLLPQLENERAANVYEMSSQFSAGLPIAGPRALQKALGQARGLTLICGSFYLLAQYYQTIEGEK